MDPFVGAEAVRAGAVGKHLLRTRFRAVYPGVYLPRDAVPNFRQRAQGAWLWSHREGVLAGLTAAKMHGAKWIDDDLPIELVWGNARPPQGILTSAVLLAAGETATLGGLPVTSLTRTAFDLARRRPVATAVARLDALGNVTTLNPTEVQELSLRHKGARGALQICLVLELHDSGAQSPKETWLRLLVMAAGFPRPRTQIPVRSQSGKAYYLDMGWEHIKVAVEYDGDQHRTSKKQFEWDIDRLEELAGLGWIVIRVVAGTPRSEIIRRLRAAWAARAPSSLR